MLDKVEQSEFGIFGRVMDPEGNRGELWQHRKQPGPSPAAPRRSRVVSHAEGTGDGPEGF